MNPYAQAKLLRAIETKEVFASGHYGGLSGRLRVNPGSGDFSLGDSYDQFNFGAGLQLGWDPQLGLTVGAGVQGRF